MLSLVHLVLEYLPLSLIFALRNVSVEYHSVIDVALRKYHVLSNRIIHQLNQHNGWQEVMLPFLKDKTWCISGSFLLQVLNYEQKWTSGDIDIYVARSSPEMNEEIWSEYWNKWEKDNQHILIEEHGQFGHIPHGYTNREFLYRVRNIIFSSSTKKIQIIEITTDDLQANIAQNFDLNILKNTFHYSLKEDNNNRKINYDHLFIAHPRDWIYHESFYNLQPYKSRFQINTVSEGDNTLALKIGRIEKYQKRGFKITNIKHLKILFQGWTFRLSFINKIEKKYCFEILIDDQTPIHYTFPEISLSFSNTIPLSSLKNNFFNNVGLYRLERCSSYCWQDCSIRHRYCILDNTSDQFHEIVDNFLSEQIQSVSRRKPF